MLCECELLLDGTAMAGELCRERVAARCAFDDAGLVARLRAALVMRDAVDAAQLTQRLNELCARHEELQRLYPAPSDAERPARAQTEAVAPPAAPPVAKPVKNITPERASYIKAGRGFAAAAGGGAREKGAGDARGLREGQGAAAAAL